MTISLAIWIYNSVICQICNVRLYCDHICDHSLVTACEVNQGRQQSAKENYTKMLVKRSVDVKWNTTCQGLTHYQNLL